MNVMYPSETEEYLRIQNIHVNQTYSSRFFEVFAAV
jgi:hypothetical protein